MKPDKTAKKQKRECSSKFKPGQSGNPHGRPKGTKNKATIIAQSLLDREAEKLVSHLIKRALAGDSTCLKLCIERLIPPKKQDTPIHLEIPVSSDHNDIRQLTGYIIQATANGEITPHEALIISRVVDQHRKSIELHEFEERLGAIENSIKEK